MFNVNVRLSTAKPKSIFFRDDCHGKINPQINYFHQFSKAAGSVMLPSDVAAELSANPPTTSEEVEGVIQRVLSLLATLEPPETIIHASHLWICLTVNRDASTDSVGGIGEEEWLIGLDIIGNLLRQKDSLLSPFEIHNVAIQASVFGETQRMELYSCTCILLCCCALWKCPPRVTSRPKRWRSLLFETVRLCQRLFDFLDIETFVKNVIPACVRVRNALPEGTDTPHWLGAFDSSVVQMSSQMALELVNGKDPNARPESIECLCQGVEHALGGNFETFLHARYFADEALHTPPISHAKWIKLWMSGLAEESDYEALAFVDTQVDEIGLAVLSFFWFDWSGRPQVFSGSHLWHLLFPSVSILLNMDECVDSQQHGFVLLQRLLSMIPDASLAPPSSQRPNHPKGTFQLLSNRMVADAASKQTSGTVISPLPNGSQAFQLMKALLAKYPPKDQVPIVQQLHKECPHQGLKPKIVDLLRDMVNWNDLKALTMAWSFLQSCIQNLEEKYVRTNKHGIHEMANLEDLVMEAEDFVAVVGLVRLWYMIRKTPTGVPNLEARLLIIKQATSHAVSTHGTLDIFRLGLLDCAIQMLLDSIDQDAMEED